MKGLKPVPAVNPGERKKENDENFWKEEILEKYFDECWNRACGGSRDIAARWFVGS